jgi:tartrate dehydratase beta subunit/fumarate hydratase class I family protein
MMIMLRKEIEQKQVTNAYKTYGGVLFGIWWSCCDFSPRQYLEGRDRGFEELGMEAVP